MTRQIIFTLDETIMQAVARLVDDAGDPREPSHSDIGAVVKRSGLAEADPANDPTARVGKQKRVRQILSWAMDNDMAAGTDFVSRLIAHLRGCGGFRPSSPNYCGQEVIETCIDAFTSEPVELTEDGLLRPRSLDSLSGRPLTEALRSYVKRAQRGYHDSVLVAGTNKDLIEATAAHVLVERFGTYSEQDNFPFLLGQAFAVLGLPTVTPAPEPGGIAGARAALSVAMYNLGCAVNRLRNKAGAGHGHPFVSDLSTTEVRGATEASGLVAGWLLDQLAEG